MVSLRRLRRAAFAAIALPLVVASGFRISRLDRANQFDVLIARLKARREDPLPGWLSRPELLAATVERLLFVLPPRRYGICLRRALILLDLWSRCGLHPTLHLGFRLTAADRGGHAWLSATAEDGRSYQISGPLDTVPVFDF